MGWSTRGEHIKKMRKEETFKKSTSEGEKLISVLDLIKMPSAKTI